MGCNSKARISSPDYNNDRNLYQKKVGKFTFSLKPLNSEELYSINFSKHTLSETQKDSIVKEYSAFKCFIFDITIQDFNKSISDYGESSGEFDSQKKTEYYLFTMQNDLALRDKFDNLIPCTIYYNERLGNLSGINRFVVGFKNTKDCELIFEYKSSYLNCGNVKIQLG